MKDIDIKKATEALKEYRKEIETLQNHTYKNAYRDMFISLGILVMVIIGTQFF